MLSNSSQDIISYQNFKNTVDKDETLLPSVLWNLVWDYYFIFLKDPLTGEAIKKAGMPWSLSWLPVIYDYDQARLAEETQPLPTSKLIDLYNITESFAVNLLIKYIKEYGFKLYLYPNENDQLPPNALFQTFNGEIQEETNSKRDILAQELFKSIKGSSEYNIFKAMQDEIELKQRLYSTEMNKSFVHINLNKILRKFKYIIYKKTIPELNFPWGKVRKRNVVISFATLTQTLFITATQLLNENNNIFIKSFLGLMLPFRVHTHYRNMSACYYLPKEYAHAKYSDLKNLRMFCFLLELVIGNAEFNFFEHFIQGPGYLILLPLVTSAINNAFFNMQNCRLLELHLVKVRESGSLYFNRAYNFYLILMVSSGILLLFQASGYFHPHSSDNLIVNSGKFFAGLPSSVTWQTIIKHALIFVQVIPSLIFQAQRNLVVTPYLLEEINELTTYKPNEYYTFAESKLKFRFNQSSRVIAAIHVGMIAYLTTENPILALLAAYVFLCQSAFPEAVRVAKNPYLFLPRPLALPTSDAPLLLEAKENNNNRLSN